MVTQFIVEDGTIVPDANSYVSVEEATAYIDANIHAGPSWDALDLISQQRLLIWSTRYLDDRADWEGTPTTAPQTDFYGAYGTSNIVASFSSTTSTPATQPLRWPRNCVVDRDGVPIPNNVIPKQLRDATSEMARFLIADDRSAERAQDGLKMLKADVVELQFKPDYFLPKVPGQISYILRGLGTISSGNLGFGKIRKV